MKISGDCVIWPGAKDRDGYGFVKIKGRVRRAHRVAMGKRIGRELGPHEIVMHLCHHRACVNADHLEIGTAAQNRQASADRRPTLAKSILGVG